ncbi:inorganic phosphate transporter 1-4-like protein [Carex littledalei]|uniref:Inorganic phosphate transporter 1-4-like protein n=1 Tax=Carex littledalei TaxID=544730 RepID=A0A833RGF7_9POAL|nr:inorganic phosphate transporter 1-4-like protein [Carex littledalei]
MQIERLNLTLDEALSKALWTKPNPQERVSKTIENKKRKFPTISKNGAQNLFQKDIFSKIGWIPKAGTMNAIEEVFRIARAQTYIALCGTVPGRNNFILMDSF